MSTRCRRFVPLCAWALALSLTSFVIADDPQPAPIDPAAPAGAVPPADLPFNEPPADLPANDPPADLPANAAPMSPTGAGDYAPPTTIPQAAPVTLPVPAAGANLQPIPTTGGLVIDPQPQMVPGVSYYYPPTPVVEANGWAGGWSGAYAPSGSYWYGVPAYTYATNYVPGYTAGLYPTSWNGYWNYSTAYGSPGYTAYWHGWYAGPPYGYGWDGSYGGGGYYGSNCGYGHAHYDYAWPTWRHRGWGYSTLGWGHGFFHRHLVWSPGCRW